MKLDFLKKLAVKLERRNNAVFSYPVEMQKKYLLGFKTPQNDFERAYDQYCCQMKLNGKITIFLLNLVSLPLLIYFYFKKNSSGEKIKHYDAVFFSEGISERVIPNSLKEEFSNWFIVKKHGELFSQKDKQYFRKLVKLYPISWHFLLKCLLKIRFYSYECAMHTPQAIVVCGEYSFTSSVLTDYCKNKGVSHINVMHGEKLYYIRDSFFRFDRCYVWDEYYAELFKELRVDKNQFLIEVPPSLKFGADIKRKQQYNYTYYLGSEDENTLKIIADTLEKLKRKGKSIVIRPHPRYSNMKQIIEIFKFAEIENLEKISIEDSLMRTGCAISVYSTVLNQALYNSVPIVIDNISNLGNYEKLRELRYVCLEKDHQLLSEII